MLQWRDIREEERKLNHGEEKLLLSHRSREGHAFILAPGTSYVKIMGEKNSSRQGHRDNDKWVLSNQRANGRLRHDL